MPLTGYQVLMTWQDGNLATSESYIWSSAADDAVTIVYPAALDLMKARSKMMGFGVLPLRFRISKIGTFRYFVNSAPQDVSTMSVGNLLLATNQPAPILAGGGSNVQDGSSDQAKSAVLMDSYNTPQSHAKKFLSGVPDVLIREDPAGPWIVGVPSWKAAFDAYVTILTSATTKWSFKGRTISNAAPYAPQNVTRIVLDLVTGLIGVQTPTMAAPTDVGSIIQLRGFKMFSTAYKNLNGQYQIDSINAGSIGGTSLYALRNTQQIVFDQIDRLGSIQLVDYSSLRYVVCTVTKDTTHKRGNRLLAGPGRRKVAQRITN